tara:strand:- start:486 stop:800 length:315 start_codon:yes stop_codon:yes gene_type:complete
MKRNYIYKNINSIKENCNLIDFIEKNNIKYRKSDNNILVNISLLSDDIIDSLYFFIKNNIKFKDDIKLNLIVNKPKEKNEVLKYIKINYFKKKDQELIILSKKI